MDKNKIIIQATTGSHKVSSHKVPSAQVSFSLDEIKKINDLFIKLQSVIEAIKYKKKENDDQCEPIVKDLRSKISQEISKIFTGHFGGCFESKDDDILILKQGLVEVIISCVPDSKSKLKIECSQKWYSHKYDFFIDILFSHSPSYHSDSRFTLESVNPLFYEECVHYLSKEIETFNEVLSTANFIKPVVRGFNFYMGDKKVPEKIDNISEVIQRILEESFKGHDVKTGRI